MARKQRKLSVVLNDKGRWTIMREGNKNPTALFDTQRDAIVNAKELAKKDLVRLDIYNTKGEVRRSHNYERSE